MAAQTFLRTCKMVPVGCANRGFYISNHHDRDWKPRGRNQSPGNSGCREGMAAESVAAQTETGSSEAITTYVFDTPWLWPTMEAAHFIGMALLFGVVLVVSLRVLGLVKSIPFTALASIITAWRFRFSHKHCDRHGLSNCRFPTLHCYPGVLLEVGVNHNWWRNRSVFHILQSPLVIEGQRRRNANSQGCSRSNNNYMGRGSVIRPNASIP